MAFLLAFALPLSGFGQDVGQLVSEGNKALASEDYAEAARLFESAIVQEPKLGGAVYAGLANCYLRLGNFEKLAATLLKTPAGKLTGRSLAGFYVASLQAGQHKLLASFETSARQVPSLKLQPFQNLLLAHSSTVEAWDTSLQIRFLRDSIAALLPGASDWQWECGVAYSLLVIRFEALRAYTDASSAARHAFALGQGISAGDSPAYARIVAGSIRERDFKTAAMLCDSLLLRYPDTLRACRAAHTGIADSALRWQVPQKGIDYLLRIWEGGLQTSDVAFQLQRLYHAVGQASDVRRFGQEALRLSTVSPYEAGSFLFRGYVAFLLGDTPRAETELRMGLFRGLEKDSAAARAFLQGYATDRTLGSEASYLLDRFSLNPEKKQAWVAATPALLITRDLVRPTLAITAPAATRGMRPVSKGAHSVRVAGVAADNRGVAVVYVNDITAGLSMASLEEMNAAGLTGAGVSFSANAMLTLGDNVIRIQAVDVDGNVTAETLVVTRHDDGISPQAVLGPGLPRIWAVVVGVSESGHKDLALQYADRDAESFYRFLISPAGGEVPVDRLKLFVNRNATRAAILNGIREVFRKAAEGDLVLLYMALHGIPDESTGEVFLMGYDGDPANPVTGMTHDEITRTLPTSRAKKVVLIVDACHSGTVGLAPGIALRGERSALTNRLLSQIATAQKGVGILTSTRASELSQEGVRWGGGHGVFTYYLVKGLSGGADVNGDGVVTLDEIYQFVTDNVVRDTAGKQHPVLQGTADNDLPLGIVR